MKHSPNTGEKTTLRKDGRKIEYGEGWSWDVEKDIYMLNDGEWNITGDVVRKEMENWGRKIEKVHIIAVLQKFYRMYYNL